jgi:mono/diheme cytochrome c family protein
VPPYVQAALGRKKIPIWAFSVLAFLPVWGWLYSQTLTPLEGSGPDQLTLGAQTFTQCAGCHGATGGGGAGRPLNNGEVLKTFPTIEGQLEFVAIGSAGVGQGVTYGDPAREGGAHTGNSFNGSAMPAYSASLTQEQLLAVVRHEREVVSGEEVPAEHIGPNGELLHANGTPYLDEEGVLVDESGAPLFDASSKLATPIDYAALAAEAGG